MYYASNKKSIRATRRGRYALAEPKPDVRQMYVKKIQRRLLGNSKARVRVTAAFKKQEGNLVKRMSRVLGRAVCSVAAKRLLNKALQMRKLGLYSRVLGRSMPFRLVAVKILV